MFHNNLKIIGIKKTMEKVISIIHFICITQIKSGV